MQDVMFALTLLAILSVPFGLIRPKLFGGGRVRALGLSLVLVVITMVGFGATLPPREPAQETSAVAGSAPQLANVPIAAPAVVPAAAPAAPQAGPQAKPAPVAAPAPAAPLVPAAQAQMIAIVDDFAAKFEAAPNEMVRGAMRPARATALCAAIKPDVRDWVGTIERLSSTADGDGVLEVRLSPRLSVQTWNIRMADSSDRTLIRPGTPLHQAVAVLAEGRKVRFSGTLLRDQSDCFNEMSMSVRGAMTEPEFLFRFSSVKPE